MKWLIAVALGIALAVVAFVIPEAKRDENPSACDRFRDEVVARNRQMDRLAADPTATVEELELALDDVERTMDMVEAAGCRPAEKG